jgi:hypothetical protein
VDSGHEHRIPERADADAANAAHPVRGLPPRLDAGQAGRGALVADLRPDYQHKLGEGQHQHVAVRHLTTESYSAGNQNAAYTKVVSGTTTVSAIAGGITLPAESILVLKSDEPSGITLGRTARSNTFTAGSKVTLTGKLTLDGAPAPAGVTVEIYRRVSGSSTNSASRHGRRLVRQSPIAS